VQLNITARMTLRFGDERLFKKPRWRWEDNTQTNLRLYWEVHVTVQPENLKMADYFGYVGVDETIMLKQMLKIGQ
jgi:hypothetical protein